MNDDDDDDDGKVCSRSMCSVVVRLATRGTYTDAERWDICVVGTTGMTAIQSGTNDSSSFNDSCGCWWLVGIGRNGGVGVVALCSVQVGTEVGI